MAVTIRGKTLPLPILQGGMGVGISLDGLAGAVAACGGMGTLSTAVCGFAEPDFAQHPFEANLRALERQVRRAKELAHGAGLIAVNAMVAKIAEEVGPINILFNNAGIIKRIPMTEMSVEDFRQVVDIDLNAPFIVSKAVIPGMIKKGHGKIINICSMMSELGRETVSAYAAAKGGLKMLTRNICSEFGEHNIQCNGIGPGYIATPQTAPLRERQADGSRHPFDSFIISKTPAARWGTPEDLMGPAVFLASDASDFVNGHVLYVDGGILAYIGKQP